MARESPAHLEMNLTEGNIEFILDDEDFFRGNLEESGHRLHGLSGEIHVGVRHEAVELVAPVGSICVHTLELGFPGSVFECGTIFEKHPRNIMARVRVFRTGISESNDELEHLR
jgi:hypothetical protein